MSFDQTSLKPCFVPSEFFQSRRELSNKQLLDEMVDEVVKGMPQLTLPNRRKIRKFLSNEFMPQRAYLERLGQDTDESQG